MVLPEEPLTGLGDWRVARQLAWRVARHWGWSEPAGWASRALWLLLASGGWEGCGQQDSSVELEPGAQPWQMSCPPGAVLCGDHLTAWAAGLAVKLFTPKIAESWVSPRPVLPVG